MIEFKPKKVNPEDRKCRICGAPAIQYMLLCHEHFKEYARLKQQIYKSGRSNNVVDHHMYDELTEKECVLCHAKFTTIYQLQKACMSCLHKNEGLDYAKWWNEHHPINMELKALGIQAQMKGELQ